MNIEDLNDDVAKRLEEQAAEIDRSDRRVGRYPGPIQLI